MNDEVLQRIQQVYGVENWSAGYFDISSKGHILVRPGKDDPRYVDLKELVDDLLSKHKLQMPLLIRFPQLLTSQLRALSGAYQSAISQYGFSGLHYPVFPMKVNPRREVVEEFLRESGRLRVGLECGSKAELYAAIAQEQTPESLLLCNGFKDEVFVRTALLGVQAGKRVTIIVEKLNELKMVIKLAGQLGVAPWIGLRAKLYSRGSGKWASSGGDSAKFGLTTSELLDCVRLLRETKLDGQLKLLHFHIGSQITDIKRVKNAMKEAARVYAKLRQIGCGIEFLDIGGGLGVDYDGSQTRFESSVNYTVQEFANDVVYVIKQVCDEENVPHPNLVTESGRFMTAYHTVFITSIRDEIETFAEDKPEITIDADDPQVITELKDLCDGINGKNYAEYYHDALEHKDELHTQFNLGLISLEDRAKGEVLFWEACARALKESEEDKFPDDEFESLKKILAQKYLCNFSLFRSAPDSWAIKQLFPIVPIHRLNENPSDFATLVDVTCDSDGKIDKFVDLKDVKETLELHKWKVGDDYYLGIFLVGAYQEVMGSHHNLFGNPNEAQVVIDSDGRYHVTKLVHGSRINDMLVFARYDRAQLVESYRKQVTARVEAGALSKETAAQLVVEYEAGALRGTYLE
ncbi:biosynthetic arginine decarboxylase [Schlesneria paludicola]|uniref:biosynthetic arginine decarboxylase n=1 Tax=Schlesneria paludicola TaxID=360056 RepID=UPI00029A52E0|nr:biosynthetic arginine decarboxylase [Schlesneria paludicola]